MPHLQTFQNNLPPPSSPIRWRQHIPQKRRQIYTIRRWRLRFTSFGIIPIFPHLILLRIKYTRKRNLLLQQQKPKHIHIFHPTLILTNTYLIWTASVLQIKIFCINSLTNSWRPSYKACSTLYLWKETTFDLSFRNLRLKVRKGR
jgi:hypothetical protein